MPNDFLRTFLIGDIIGRYGRKFLKEILPFLKKKYSPGLIIANGENIAGGIGITRKTAEEVLNAGVHIITTGNHVWDKKEALELLKNENQIIRPMNFLTSNPGKGFVEFETADKTKAVIINLQGRVFMEPVVENPFITIDKFLKKIKNNIIIVDFHAEASAEKQAMGFFLDGRVSAVLGTHTHVPSADLRILTGGTAFQTDVGMTGSIDSVIGMKKQPIIKKFITGINQRFEVARGNMIMDLAILDINKSSGKTSRVQALRITDSNYSELF